MAKKHTLAKTARYFGKEDRVYVERKGNRYFITEGHVILALNENLYKENFVYKYPRRFPELEDGERITSDKKEIHPDGVKMADYIESEKKRAAYDVTRTRLTYETNRGHKVQIYKGKEPIFINTLFDEMATEIFWYDAPTMKGTDHKSPIILSDHNEEQEFLMLPVYLADRKEVEQEMMYLFN